jgi:DMSO/TMAO reductase YedYZ heme-binding membrane subunit
MPPFKEILKQSFAILSVAIICLTIYGFNNFKAGQMYDISTPLGYLAAILFLLSILPGIVQRLKITSLNSITNPLRYSRRTLGVAMFFAALSHYLFGVLFHVIKFNRLPEPKLYFFFGLLALFLSLWLALTSNTFAKKKMGKWWKRLHSATYLIVWLIFAHVVLIDISLISVLILIFAVLETYSLVKVNILDKKKILPV